jgi:MFS family permease
VTAPQTESEALVGAERLAPAEVSRGLRISVVEGAFATGHVALTGGMFLTGLALFLGANSFQIGLLAAIPALVSVFGFAAGFLVRRAGARKGLAVWTSGIGRAAFIVLVPLLLLKLRFGLGPFFAVILAYNVLLVTANTTWNSWMSDLVPEDRRGRFFGLRNAVLGGIAMVLTYVGGRGLDWFKTFDEGLGYGVAYALAVGFGIASTLILARQPEPPLVPRPRVPLRERLFGPLQNEPQFRRLVVFLAVWFLTSTMASPFYIVHMIQNLKFSFASIGIYAAIGGTVGILFQLYWGWVVDRFGPKPVTLVSFGLVGLCPILWLFATETFRAPIWMDGLVNGIGWTGANLGLINLVFALGDNPVRKESYFALFSVVVGLATFIASLAGGALAQLLAGLRFELLGRTFINHHVLFLISGVARFACLPLIARIQERRSRTVVRTVQVLGAFAVNRLNYGKGVFLSALRTRSRG